MLFLLLLGANALPIDETKIRSVVSSNISSSSSKIGSFLGISQTINIEQAVKVVIKVLEYMQEGTAIWKAAKNGDVAGVFQIITEVAATEFPEYATIIRLSGKWIATIVVQLVQSK